MKLREWDWDKQVFIEVEYPDAPVMEFVNFIRTTKAWVQDPERMHRAVLKMDKALGEHRQAIRDALALTAQGMTGKTPAKPTLEDVLAAARRPDAPEWLQMCAAEIHELRALTLQTPKGPLAKGGRRAAHAKG